MRVRFMGSAFYKFISIYLHRFLFTEHSYDSTRCFIKWNTFILLMQVTCMEPIFCVKVTSPVHL